MEQIMTQVSAEEKVVIKTHMRKLICILLKTFIFTLWWMSFGVGFIFSEKFCMFTTNFY